MKKVLGSLFLWIGQNWGVVPLLVHKDITCHFSDVTYSPLIGAAALESGLLSNLRFYCNYKPGWDSTLNRRKYVADQGLDSMS